MQGLDCQITVLERLSQITSQRVELTLGWQIFCTGHDNFLIFLIKLGQVEGKMFPSNEPSKGLADERDSDCLVRSSN